MRISFFSWIIAVYCLISANANVLYSLDTVYAGSTFLDGWDFFTSKDPTHGFVEYVSRAEAESAGLVDVNPAYLGVDSVHHYNTTSLGRKSVRITTKRSWTKGLFIADIFHMPASVCGVWPALWTLGPNWPYSGEIDIIEGINRNVSNSMTLHTGPNCTINYGEQSGHALTNQCHGELNNNAGCSIRATTPVTYGSEFNDNEGGVYAMEWTSDYVKIWFFPRDYVPDDIIDGCPDPCNWPQPQSFFRGGKSCNIDGHFKNHNIVFDTTFCGDLAGTLYPTDPLCAAKGGCVNWVANHPRAFRDVYWEINSIKVYQIIDEWSSSSTNQSALE